MKITDDSIITNVFIAITLALFVNNIYDTTQVVELHAVTMKTAEPYCVGVKCLYERDTKITFAISRTNQFVTYVEEIPAEDRIVVNKLEDCVVVDKNNFRCKDVVRNPKFLYFKNHKFISTSRLLQWISNYVPVSLNALDFFEKYIP